MRRGVFMNEAFAVEAFLDKESETFTYVVFDKKTKKAIVIDPVLDFDVKSGRTSTKSSEKIAAFIEQNSLSLEWVLETHAHADHLSSAIYFKERFDAPIGIGEHIIEVQRVFKEVFNLDKEFLPNGEHFDHLFKDGETFQVGELTIKVMHAPGHTPADIVFVINDQVAFVGDTLFMPDVGTARCDFPGGSAATLYDSIQKILSLPDNTEVYVCHDYPPEGRDYQCKTTVKEQKSNSIHVNGNITKEQFIQNREKRDATLAMPKLILPSIQINIRAGKMPPAEENGSRYLKIPINLL